MASTQTSPGEEAYSPSELDALRPKLELILLALRGLNGDNREKAVALGLLVSNVANRTQELTPEKKQEINRKLTELGMDTPEHLLN
jgi:lactate dehydrogenase-like 2-hydroxyacid dehydrogenase